MQAKAKKLSIKIYKIIKNSISYPVQKRNKEAKSPKVVIKVHFIDSKDTKESKGQKRLLWEQDPVAPVVVIELGSRVFDQFCVSK